MRGVGLRYIQASGRHDGGEERPAGYGTPVALGRGTQSLIKLSSASTSLIRLTR